jgi:hypothetical protein
MIDETTEKERETVERDDNEERRAQRTAFVEKFLPAAASAQKLASTRGGFSRVLLDHAKPAVCI